MKPATILFFTIFFFSSHALAWTIKADFEDGTVGARAESPTDAFHMAAGRSYYANTPALSGNQSASVSVKKGETGYGVWGGGFTFPQKLKEGDEIWYRVNVYYPTGWSFSCKSCSQGMKFMRIKTASATGSSEGYIDTYIRGDNGGSNGNDPGTGGAIVADSEILNGFYGTGKTTQDIVNLGTRINRNQWYTYEIYVKFSSVRGKGIYRIWQDGNLIFEDLVAGTLLTPTSQSNVALLYTYWNTGAPATQTSYVDDIVITNEVPSRKDAQGNPYIGVGPSIYAAPPGWPSGGSASSK